MAMDEETKKTDMTGDVMEVIDIDNYSELNRLLRVTCYVRRVKKTNRSVGEISAGRDGSRTSVMDLGNTTT